MVAQTTPNGTPATTDESDLLKLWHHLFSNQTGYVALFSGKRVPEGKNLIEPRQAFYPWPIAAGNAAQWLENEASRGRETYFTAHLLKAKPRAKENAAPIWALWADGDTATVPPDLPSPTAVVESSPGRWHYYWRLTRPLPPQQAEELNRRMTYAIGADPSGWALSKLLRPPALPNFKHPGAPLVRLVDLRDEAYCPDQLDVLLPDAGPIPTQIMTDATGAGDAPPVRLSADGLAWWHGERHAHTDDGSIDRSRTLWAIGRELAKAGATAPTIAAALADRDQALEFFKYTDGREYWRIAAKVTAELEATVPVVVDTRANGTAPPAADELAAILEEVQALREEVQQLRAENERLRDQQAATFRVLRNNKLQSRRVTALALATEVSWKLSRGEVDEEGYATILLGGDNNADPKTEPWKTRKQSAGIADRAGVSRSTASRHLQDLEDWGFIDRKLVPRQIERVDPETGEIATQWVRELKVRLHKTPAEMLLELAEFTPDKPTHGGARRACRHHPNARLIVDHVARCEECGEVVDRWQTRRAPDPTPAEDPHTDNESHHATTREIPPSVEDRIYMSHDGNPAAPIGDECPGFHDEIPTAPESLIPIATRSQRSPANGNALTTLAQRVTCMDCGGGLLFPDTKARRLCDPCYRKRGGVT